jgi:phosphopantetheinyl transferase
VPLFYQQNINELTELAIWKIEESEEFFLQKVPLQTNITHPHKRLQHLAGRYLLQFLFRDFPYEEILIADTRKPYLPNEQYHFSISHCANYAAAIVSKCHRVGIDIEKPSPKIQKILHRFLSEEERRYFFDANSPLVNAQDLLLQINAPASMKQQLQTILWSAKEAIFKWWSYGNVDFRENIRLSNFTINNSGDFHAFFIKASKEYHLQLHYKVFEDLCLAWLKS